MHLDHSIIKRSRLKILVPRPEAHSVASCLTYKCSHQPYSVSHSPFPPSLTAFHALVYFYTPAISSSILGAVMCPSLCRHHFVSQSVRCLSRPPCVPSRCCFSRSPLLTEALCVFVATHVCRPACIYVRRRNTSFALLHGCLCLLSLQFPCHSVRGVACSPIFSNALFFSPNFTIFFCAVALWVRTNICLTEKLSYVSDRKWCYLFPHSKSGWIHI